MKNLQKVFLVLCVMGLMISCGSGGGNKPEKVAVKYAEAFYKGDMDALMKLAPKDEQEKMKEAKPGELEMAKYLMAAIAEKNKDVSGIKATGTEMSEDGNSATVTIEFTKGDQTKTETVKLEKEEGEWMVTDMSGANIK